MTPLAVSSSTPLSDATSTARALVIDLPSFAIAHVVKSPQSIDIGGPLGGELAASGAVLEDDVPAEGDAVLDPAAAPPQATKTSARATHAGRAIVSSVHDSRQIFRRSRGSV